MFSAVISFLGGSVFRMIWGEISAFLTARQEHEHELDRLRLQGELDAAAHVRQLETMKAQHDMGVELIRVQSDADLGKIDADIFGRAVTMTGQLTGFAIVDVWNGVIRPALATVCIALVVLHFYRHDWTLDEQGWSLVGAALGVYVADRMLFKRGK
jgi:hypothetical protein